MIYKQGERRQIKSVLLSIQPKWCKKIFDGEKTIEVRKTRPLIDMPFKVYVYCTKKRMTRVPSMYAYLHKNEPGACAEYGTIETWGKIGDVIVNPHLASKHVSFGMHGKVIGSFICDKITRYESEFWDDDTYERIQEPWEPSDFAEYGEYEYDTIGENGEFYGKGIELSKQSCLSWNELRKYVGQGLKDFYGWHIIEPKLYDKPRELSEFYRSLPENVLENGEYDCRKAWDVLCIDAPEGGDYCAECPFGGRVPLTRPPMSWCYIETDER